MNQAVLRHKVGRNDLGPVNKGNTIHDGDCQFLAINRRQRFDFSDFGTGPLALNDMVVHHAGEISLGIGHQKVERSRIGSLQLIEVLLARDKDRECVVGRGQGIRKARGNDRIVKGVKILVFSQNVHDIVVRFLRRDRGSQAQARQRDDRKE